MQTLERSYLLRINGQVVERPQHMLMRVALGIWKHDLDQAICTYQLLSERWCDSVDSAGAKHATLTSANFKAHLRAAVEALVCSRDQGWQAEEPVHIQHHVAQSSGRLKKLSPMISLWLVWSRTYTGRASSCCTALLRALGSNAST